MKPRFEEHEGQLFRMLEEPVPLTPDAEMPCLVRLIQDDTMLGKANKRSCHPDAIRRKIVCTELTDDGLFMQRNYSYRYEIIGYPVADGSLWWALWAMMEENKVINSNGIVPFTLTDDRIVRIDDSVSWDVGHWLRIFDDTTGWQIYKEPKIEPPKEPDYVICKRCGGSKSVLNPAVSNTAYTICPKCGGTGYEIKEQKPDNLYLNIKPSNPVDWCFDKKNLLVLVDDNFKGIVGENVTREQVVEIAKLLTEPAKEQFKVGDWVTDGVVVGPVAVINDGKAWVKTKDAQYHLSVEHLRKLKPSEVVLDFGNGIKGTVRSCEHDGGCVRVISGDRVIAHIMTDVLEQPTCNIVMQLLKAQEEK